MLGTVVFDLGRFGIQFVASPRHADGLVVTGPGQREHALGPAGNLRGVPAPKLVIAVGAEAISGGVFRGQPRGPRRLRFAAARGPVTSRAARRTRLTILDGLLRLLGRLEGKGAY